MTDPTFFDGIVVGLLIAMAYDSLGFVVRRALAPHP